MQEKFVVYILRTSGDTLYIGQTNNLERRMKEHMSKSIKTAKYLRAFATYTLVYQEVFSSRREAMQREIALKKLTKKQKEILIRMQTTHK